MPLYSMLWTMMSECVRTFLASQLCTQVYMIFPAAASRALYGVAGSSAVTSMPNRDVVLHIGDVFGHGTKPGVSFV
jgi:hypothetical protein